MFSVSRARYGAFLKIWQSMRGPAAEVELLAGQEGIYRERRELHIEAQELSIGLCIKVEILSPMWKPHYIDTSRAAS